jgi:glycosyltransferase involved in cell wall biosynthesis
VAEGRLRIACAIGQFDPRGSEQQLFNYLKHADRRRFEPEVWVMYAGGDWERPIRQLGVEVIPFSRWPKIERPYRMRRLARQRQIDLYWSWSYYLNQYACCLPHGTQAVGTLHETLKSARAQVGFRRWLCEQGPRLILANSPEGLQELRAGGLRGDADWVGNSYDAPEISARSNTTWRERLGAAPGARLIVGVGHFNPDKNFALLLEAMAGLPGADMRLALVGDGPERAALEARAARPDLAGRVVFPGRVPGAAELIAAADLLAHPSRSEGMPNVVMEALAAGVPAVATQVNGIRHLIASEQEGWVVPQDDPAALRQGMAAALADLPAARCKAARARTRLLALHDARRVAGLREAWLLYALNRGPRPPAFSEAQSGLPAPQTGGLLRHA